MISRAVLGCVFVLAASIGPARAEMGPCRPAEPAALVCGAGNGAARVIPKTTSPSGRLALAWRWSGPPTEKPDNDGKSETLLVRLEDGAIIATSKTSYWNTGVLHSDGRSEQAFWSPDSRYVVRVFDTETATEAMDVHVLAADDKHRGWIPLRSTLLAQLREGYGRTHGRLRGYAFYVVSDPAPEIDNDGRLRARIRIAKPKEPVLTFDASLRVVTGPMRIWLSALRRVSVTP